MCGEGGESLFWHLEQGAKLKSQARGARGLWGDERGRLDANGVAFKIARCAIGFVTPRDNEGGACFVPGPVDETTRRVANGAHSRLPLGTICASP